MSKLPDHDIRDRIRTELDRNMMIEAAAGTGTTTALIDRIVQTIVRGVARVPAIAVLTFTEKAAGELKLRLRSELERSRTIASPEDLPPIEQALVELEEARVSTIHTFCADLLRERPVEAGVDPAFQVLSEPEAARLLRSSVDLWFQRKLDDLPEGLRRLLRRIPRGGEDDPLEALRRAVLTLAEWRNFNAPWQRDAFDREQEIETLVSALHAYADLLRDCDNTANDNLYKDTSAAIRVSDEMHRREQLGERDDVDYLEARLVDLLRRPFINARGGRAGKFGPNTKRANVRHAYEILLFQLRSFEARANADLAALLHEELRGAIEHYEEQKRRIGALDFVDLLLRVRDLLCGHEPVRRYFQRILTHLFIDEFQDTDPIQVEILMLLASEDPVTDWKSARPKAGKLFLIGDPKQSIYRFRRADLGMYADVRHRLEASGAVTLDLSTSFRSVPDIQNFANAAFRKVMSGDGESQQADYVPLVRHRSPIANQPAVVALPVPKPYNYRGISEEAIEASLPDVVAAYVEWLLAKSGWKVTPRDKESRERAIEARDICILFRRFESFGFDGKRHDVTHAYVQCLEARGIPQLLTGGKSFHQREEIETMRTAVTAIEWPEDELSVYATLRGSLFGITDEELFEYRSRFQRLKPFSIPSDVPEHLQPIATALQFIASLHGGRNYRPVADTLRRLFTETRCHAGFVVRPSGKQVLANVMQLMERARVYDESGALSFRGFVTRLDDEATHGRFSEAPVLEEGSEGVQLMTVHKAKGLEFPVVILADINCNETHTTASRHVDAEANLCAMSICGFRPVDLIRNEAAELERERAEAVRLAYVAVTRARDLLVVPAVADERVEGKWISLLNDALYPRPGQKPHSSPGTPPFGTDSTIRPYEFVNRGDDTVKPGTYDFEDHSVTWWDPFTLRLDVPITLGIPQRELLGKDAPEGVVETDLANYQSWRAGRDATIEEGAVPLRRVQTAIERSMSDGESSAVDVVSIRRDPAFRHGARYGSLLHAVLATIDLDGSTETIRAVASLQGRILGALTEEVEAAVSTAMEVLAHPLMQRAARSANLRREVPLTVAEADVVIEGVADLAFEEKDGWIVVDFKTDAEIGDRLQTYKRQIGVYVEAIAKATGRPAAGTLFQV